jgi:hypothetical protein
MKEKMQIFSNKIICFPSHLTSYLGLVHCFRGFAPLFILQPLKGYLVI